MVQLADRIQGPISVIGDVHGQVDKLLTVLDRLKQRSDFEQRWLVFIGDLVDRGPNPKAALDVICDLMLEHERTTVVCGNHELAMGGALGLLPTPDYADWSTRWTHDYGAESTIASYGLQPGDELSILRDLLPTAHSELLSSLPWCVEHPEYLFVHAGLDPHTPFDIQMRILRQKDFSLNRPAWLCSKSLATSPVPSDCPFTVVSGHVPMPEVTFRRKRLLVDTTGGFQGDLSCVLLPENQVISSGSDPAPQTVVAASDGSSKKWWKVW